MCLIYIFHLRAKQVVAVMKLRRCSQMQPVCIWCMLFNSTFWMKLAEVIKWARSQMRRSSLTLCTMALDAPVIYCLNFSAARALCHNYMHPLLMKWDLLLFLLNQQYFNQKIHLGKDSQGTTHCEVDCYYYICRHWICISAFAASREFYMVLNGSKLLVK